MRESIASFLNPQFGKVRIKIGTKSKVLLEFSKIHRGSCECYFIAYTLTPSSDLLFAVIPAEMLRESC